MCGLDCLTYDLDCLIYCLDCLDCLICVPPRALNEHSVDQHLQGARHLSRESKGGREGGSKSEREREGEREREKERERERESERKSDSDSEKKSKREREGERERETEGESEKESERKTEGSKPVLEIEGARNLRGDLLSLVVPAAPSHHHRRPHLYRIKSSFSAALISTTRRRIPASASTNQGNKKGTLVAL